MKKIAATTQGPRSRKKTADSEAWLCIRFTHLSLNSLGISAASTLPSASTDKQQIKQCNHAATNAGIADNMSVSHALMLLPELCLVEREPKKEQQKQLDLAFWAYRFSSMVCLYNRKCIAIEIGKSIKLFNGLEQLLNLIEHDLAQFQMAYQLGVAHTVKAAHLLSFSQQQHSIDTDHCIAQLQQCAIRSLDIEEKAIRQLHHCGLELIADLKGIPLAELGQRFGITLLNYLQQLWGHTADPQIATTPPDTFLSSADFAEPIRNLNWINQQIDRLLNDLEYFIKDRKLICRGFTWRFFHENNRLLETINIGLSSTQNTARLFRELSDLKLANLKLNWEFSSIELSSSQMVPIQLFNNDLFDPLPDQQQFKQLIDKLISRLGEQAIFRVEQAPEHLPELANAQQYAIQEQSSHYHVNQPSNQQAANKHKDQPLWLLERPQRLAQQQRQPLHQGPLNLIHGPDRISSHWWAKLQSRDYFIARQRNGRLLWVFYERSSKHWFLHGLFA